MSCTISISDAPEDIWMIRNAIFRWLNRIIRTRCEGDSDLLQAMHVAEACGGISLDSTRREDPDLADRITSTLLSLSREIAAGEHALCDDDGNPWQELQSQCDNAFSALHELLSRWNKIEEKPTTE